MRELELERHGYQVYPQHGYFVPYRDGRALQLPDDDPARRARADRAVLDAPTPTRSTRWDAWLGGLADVLGPLLDDDPAARRLAPARATSSTRRALAWTAARPRRRAASATSPACSR